MGKGRVSRALETQCDDTPAQPCPGPSREGGSAGAHRPPSHSASAPLARNSLTFAVPWGATRTASRAITA